MTKKLPLVLGLAILLVFGVVVAGMHLYEPFRFMMLKKSLASTDAAVRESAAREIAKKKSVAIPYIRKWLRSSSDAQVVGACRVLELMEGKTWEGALPEIMQILDRGFSEKTDAAAAVLVAHDHTLPVQPGFGSGWREEYENNRSRVLNIALFLLRKSPFAPIRGKAALILGEVRFRPAFKFLETAVEKDDVGDVRLECMKALWNIDEKEFFHVALRALKGNSLHSVRTAAINHIMDIYNGTAVPYVIRALRSDPDPEVRRHAVYVLGKCGGEIALAPIVTALKNDSSYLVRAAAAEMLGCMNYKKAFELLAGAVSRDPHYYVREKAALALGRLGDVRSVEFLIPFVSRNVPFNLRCVACSILGEFRDKRAVGPLIEVIKDKVHVSLGFQAVRALGRIGDPRAIGPVLEAMSKPDSGVRMWVGELDNLKGDGALEAYVGFFMNTSGLTENKYVDVERIKHVREIAVKMTGRLNNPGAVKFLAGIVQNDDRRISPVAERGLRGITNPEATDELTDLLENSSNAKIRMLAVTALGNIDHPGAVEALAKSFLKDPDEKVRNAALDGLRRKPAPSAVGVYVKLTKSKSGSLKDIALDALMRLKDAGGLKPLVEHYAHLKPVGFYVNPSYRLGVFNSGEAACILRDMNENHDDAKVRDFAGRVLAGLKLQLGISDLIDILDNESNEMMRTAAIRTLIKTRDPAIFKPLCRELERSYDTIRRRNIIAGFRRLEADGVLPLFVKLLDREKDPLTRRIILYTFRERKYKPAAAGIRSRLKKENHWAVKCACLGALKVLDPEGSFDTFLGMLNEQDMRVRREAINALGDSGDARAVGPLVESFNDKNVHATVGALRKLTGGDFGLDASAWKKWYDRNKKAGKQDGAAK